VPPEPASLLATRCGKLPLRLLCAVQFLDVVDSSIMNVALPSIRRDLGFSAQGPRWVLSGYLVTCGACCCWAAAPAACSDSGRCSWRAPRYSPRQCEGRLAGVFSPGKVVASCRYLLAGSAPATAGRRNVIASTIPTTSPKSRWARKKAICGTNAISGLAAGSSPQRMIT
jgi:MFS family permease